MSTIQCNKKRALKYQLYMYLVLMYVLYNYHGTQLKYKPSEGVPSPNLDIAVLVIDLETVVWGLAHNMWVWGLL